jgi:hypothetical protein
MLVYYSLIRMLMLLAKEIQHLMTDADYYKMIADRCMKRAEEFDISKTAEGYRRVYEELKKK